MKFIAPLDAMCLLAESREHPMHVAALQLFTPPHGAGPEFVRDIYEAMRQSEDVQPAFRKHPAKTFGAINNAVWSFEDDIDLGYHVRRSALPTPGRVRELLDVTSRLHAGLLDRHRPLWETHVIEGLADARFAVYTKMHHAVVDGVSALKLLQGSLSADPHDSQIRVPWSLPPRRSHQSARRSRRETLAGALGSVAGLAPSTLTVTRAALVEQQLTLPLRAPRTMLNVPIGGARRCATQSWSLGRIKDVTKAAGATINDVVLAMCAGALRAYLTDHDALPDAPLVAMVPVSLRTEHDAAGGNIVSAILCNLATDLDDPAERLHTIHESMRDNKKVLSQLPRAQAMALGAFLLAPAAFSGVAGLGAVSPPPFNIAVSNVPGVREPLYCNGARLDGNYPLSIAVDGMALNITLATSAESLDFGLVGCPQAVPHLQRLLGHLETALKDLERAVGL